MKIAVIGIGNIIFQDEGIGVYASKYIEQNYKFNDDVTMVDGGVLGFGLINYCQNFDKILILDTITIDDEIGSIYNLPANELLGLGNNKQTAHEIEVIDMLEICSIYENMADVSIIGVVPQDIKSVNIGLSDEILKVFDSFIAVVIKELDNLGVKYIKNNKEVSIQSIIQNYIEPKLKS